MIKRTLACSLAIVLLCAAHQLTAQTLNVPETFGDGGPPVANGWTVGSSGAVVSDLGENGAGDNAVDYGTESGLHFLHPEGGTTPNPVFLGDYLSAGATALRFNARHSGVGDTVALRATMFLPIAPDVDWAMSTVPVELTPNDTTWQTYELSLAPADLVSGGTNGVSPTDVLANVARLGLRHDPLGAGPQSPAFVSTITNVYFDDVTLVPEPTSLGLLLMGLLAFRRRRYGQQRQLRSTKRKSQEDTSSRSLKNSGRCMSVRLLLCLSAAG